jgi:HSP20 family protein
MAYRLASPQPWGVFDELRREMDALFSRVAGAPAVPETSGVFPPVNLYETADALVLTAELPGVAADEIEVSIEGSTLTLRGERKIAYPDERDVAVHRAERRSGVFRRAIELPLEIDAEKVEAVHRNGVLLLRLPKAALHRPQRIPVQGS